MLGHPGLLFGLLRYFLFADHLLHRGAFYRLRRFHRFQWFLLGSIKRGTSCRCGTRHCRGFTTADFIKHIQVDFYGRLHIPLLRTRIVRKGITGITNGKNSKRAEYRMFHSHGVNLNSIYSNIKDDYMNTGSIFMTWISHHKC